MEFAPLWDILQSFRGLDSELTSVLTAVCPDVLEQASPASELHRILGDHGWDPAGKGFGGPIDRTSLLAAMAPHVTAGFRPREKPEPYPIPRRPKPPRPCPPRAPPAANMTTRRTGLVATDTFYSPAAGRSAAQ